MQRAGNSDNSMKAQRRRTTLEGMIWFREHSCAALDAVSYIISLYIVDILTFGRPILSDGQHAEQSQHIFRSLSVGEERENKRSSINYPRRTASDPGTVGLRYYPNSSAAFMGTVSIPHKISRTEDDRHRFVTKPDGLIHHNQLKLFDRQVSYYQCYNYLKLIL